MKDHWLSDHPEHHNLPNYSWLVDFYDIFKAAKLCKQSLQASHMQFMLHSNSFIAFAPLKISQDAIEVLQY